MAGVTAMEASPPNPHPDKMSELLYQIKRFHSFLWASGGCYSDFLIHNIDECCWIKDAWPVQANGLGGRLYRGNNIDQNFDVYSIEYTFPDGAKLLLEGRNVPAATRSSPASLTAARAPQPFPTQDTPRRSRSFTRARVLRRRI